MTAKTLLLLLFALPCTSPPVWGSAPPALQDPEQAEEQFRDALRSRDAERKRAALEALVATGHPDAAPPILAEYSRCATGLRSAAYEVERLEDDIAHRERMIATLVLRAERDESLEPVIATQRLDLEDVEKERERQMRVVEREGPWRDALSAGTRRLFEGLDRGKRRGAEKALWKGVSELEDPAQRIATVEILGDVGADGTALELQKLMAGVAATRWKLLKKLPKEQAEVRKLEARMQHEARESGGRMSGASMDQYNRAKTELEGMQRTLTLLGGFCDACVAAAGSALGREQGETLERSLAALTRAYKKAKSGARLRTLAILAQVDAEPAAAELRALLEGEKDPAVIGRILIDLATLGDETIVPWLLERYLAHESWHVRHRAAESLAILRSKEAIPVLIGRLSLATGRTRTDIRAALRSLTAQDFHTNAELWRRWWTDNGADFEVPPEERADEVAQAAQRVLGVTFFGISTESQRVLFVLDVSGSMEFSMVPRDNPNDEPGAPPDLPRDGEISRLTAAKRDLIQALGGLGEGALFNLVLYATDVWSWQDDLVSMDTDARAGVREYIDSIEAVGGTNIYGALQQALEMAGAEAGDEWSAPAIDTIFLLSDGRASMGVSTEPDEILSMVRELNESAGIVIHTIGLSGAQDAYLLRNLAEQNDGTYAAR